MTDLRGGTACPPAPGAPSGLPEATSHTWDAYPSREQSCQWDKAEMPQEG